MSLANLYFLSRIGTVIITTNHYGKSAIKRFIQVPCLAHMIVVTISIIEELLAYVHKIAYGVVLGIGCWCLIFTGSIFLFIVFGGFGNRWKPLEYCPFRISPTLDPNKAPKPDNSSLAKDVPESELTKPIELNGTCGETCQWLNRIIKYWVFDKNGRLLDYLDKQIHQAIPETFRQLQTTAGSKFYLAGVTLTTFEWGSVAPIIDAVKVYKLHRQTILLVLDMTYTGNFEMALNLAMAYGKNNLNVKISEVKFTGKLVIKLGGSKSTAPSISVSITGLYDPFVDEIANPDRFLLSSFGIEIMWNRIGSKYLSQLATNYARNQLLSRLVFPNRIKIIFGEGKYKADQFADIGDTSSILALCSKSIIPLVICCRPGPRILRIKVFDAIFDPQITGREVVSAYCTISFGEHRARTPVINESNYPIWDFSVEFVFDGILCTMFPEEFELRVYHYRRLGTSSLLHKICLQAPNQIRYNVYEKYAGGSVVSYLRFGLYYHNPEYHSFDIEREMIFWNQSTILDTEMQIAQPILSDEPKSPIVLWDAVEAALIQPVKEDKEQLDITTLSTIIEDQQKTSKLHSSPLSDLHPINFIKDQLINVLNVGLLILNQTNYESRPIGDQSNSNLALLTLSLQPANLQLKITLELIKKDLLLWFGNAKGLLEEYLPIVLKNCHQVQQDSRELAPYLDFFTQKFINAAKNLQTNISNNQTVAYIKRATSVYPFVEENLASSMAGASAATNMDMPRLKRIKSFSTGQLIEEIKVKTNSQSILCHIGMQPVFIEMKSNGLLIKPILIKWKENHYMDSFYLVNDLANVMTMDGRIYQGDASELPFAKHIDLWIDLGEERIWSVQHDTSPFIISNNICLSLSHLLSIQIICSPIVHVQKSATTKASTSSANAVLVLESVVGESMVKTILLAPAFQVQRWIDIISPFLWFGKSLSNNVMIGWSKIKLIDKHEMMTRPAKKVNMLDKSMDKSLILEIIPEEIYNCGGLLSSIHSFNGLLCLEKFFGALTIHQIYLEIIIRMRHENWPKSESSLIVSRQSRDVFIVNGLKNLETSFLAVSPLVGPVDRYALDTFGLITAYQPNEAMARREFQCTFLRRNGLVAGKLMAIKSAAGSWFICFSGRRNGIRIFKLVIPAMAILSSNLTNRMLSRGIQISFRTIDAKEDEIEEIYFFGFKKEQLPACYNLILNCYLSPNEA